MIPLADNTMRIETPEGVTFSLDLAGPLRRMFALLLDGLILSAVTMAVVLTMAMVGVREVMWYQGAVIFCVLLLPILYGTLLEWLWRGQTIGKKVLQIRVADEQGLNLRPSQVFARNVGRLVDLLPAMYLVGGIACLLTRRVQRLGDIAGGTIVVLTRQTPPPDLDQIGPRVFNSLLQHPHIVGRLRQRIRPAEAAVALQALLRRNELDPGARLTLFARLAEYFRDLVPTPGDTDEGLSDEQYVRNVVDAMYRRD
ncbi:MAG: RDD family protein [Planctomycetota bacterium]